MIHFQKLETVELFLGCFDLIVKSQVPFLCIHGEFVIGEEKKNTEVLTDHIMLAELCLKLLELGVMSLFTSLKNVLICQFNTLVFLLRKHILKLLV